MKKYDVTKFEFTYLRIGFWTHSATFHFIICAFLRRDNHFLLENRITLCPIQFYHNNINISYYLFLKIKRNFALSNFLWDIPLLMNQITWVKLTISLFELMWRHSFHSELWDNPIFPGAEIFGPWILTAKIWTKQVKSKYFEWILFPLFHIYLLSHEISSCVNENFSLQLLDLFLLQHFCLHLIIIQSIGKTRHFKIFVYIIYIYILYTIHVRSRNSFIYFLR